MIEEKLKNLLPLKIREYIKQNEEVERILKNINWLTLENILRSFISLIVFAWVARYLGPNQFGLMTYAFAFVTLFSSFSTLGLDSLVIKKLIERPGNKGNYLGSTFLLKLVGSLTMIILSVLVIRILEPNDKVLQFFVLVIALGYIVKPLDTIDVWFQSKVKAKYSVIARSSAFIVVSLMKLIFILTGAPLLAFVVMYSLELLLAAIVLIAFYLKKEGQIISAWKGDKNTVKELVKDSWPLFLGAIAALIYMKIDQVMIGSMIGQEKVGIYYSAVKLSEVWYFIPTIVSASVFPAILNARKKSNILYKQRLQTLFDFSAWFSILVAIFITIFAPLIIKILYGEEYSESASVLSVHIWSGVFVFLGAIASKWVIAENYTRNALIRTVIGAILNIILNYFLIKAYGVIGAAISTLISYSFVNYFSLFFYGKTRECFVMQSKTFNIFRFVKPALILHFIVKKISIFFLKWYYEFCNYLLKRTGITEKKRETQLIITLTSYPKRFKALHLTLESLLQQNLKPDRIILWLSKEEVNEKSLPEKIKKLQRRGLEVRYVDGNIRSYKKLVYAIKEYPKELLITVDDDMFYPRNFLNRIYKKHQQHRDKIVAYRCTYMRKSGSREFTKYTSWENAKGKKPSFNLFPTGAGGILYPPGSLYKDIFNEKLFMKLAPTADDIWFKAMGILNKRKVIMVEDNSIEFLGLKSSQATSLWEINVVESRNDIQLKEVFDYYDLYKYIE